LRALEASSEKIETRTAAAWSDAAFAHAAS
jgi:hypothetical protein